MDPNAAMPTQRLSPGTVIAQTTHEVTTRPVSMETPALEVMTDLTRVKPATVNPSTSLRQAEQMMIYQGVRMLFVLREMPAIEGLVTATDLHGDVQMRLVEQRGARYDELTVADVMTRLTNLDAIDFEDLKRASVGNVVATLRRLGRHHLLVTEQAANVCRVRGVISRSQVERQLGTSIHVTEVARTFPDLVQMLS